MFEGSCVALVTPMTPTGEIDENVVINLVEWHIQEGTKAIVVAGSTGESATLTLEEQLKLFGLVVKAVNKRIPVIAGTGTNATASTITRTQKAKELGVDGCLIVAPYYNRPTQGGLKAHFQAVANAVKLPILLYNVPSRTSCDMLPETVAALSEVPGIIGIKEATGNIQRLQELREKCQRDFLFFSGDDPSCLEFMRQGGKGVISITTNVVPQVMQKICQHALMGEFEKAQSLDNTLQALHRMLIIEPNPIPVKWALNNMGKIPEGIRLPLTHLSAEYHDKLKQALQTAGIYTRNFSF